MAQRHGRLRRTQLRNTFRVEPGEHLGRSERRIDIAGRLVQFQLAALHELQGSDRRQQFDHRGDAEDRIGRQTRRRGHVAEAERALIDDRLFVRGHRDNARYFPGADFCAQRSVYFLASGRPARRCGAAGNRRGRYHACGRKRRCPQQRITPGDGPCHVLLEDETIGAPLGTKLRMLMQLRLQYNAVRRPAEYSYAGRPCNSSTRTHACRTVPLPA